MIHLYKFLIPLFMSVVISLFMSVVIPLFMGTLAHFLGLEAAFYVIGILGIVLLLGAALWARRVEPPPL